MKIVSIIPARGGSKGISKKNIRKLKLLSIKGFGGISLFKKKTGLKEAGFHKE